MRSMTKSVVVMSLLLCLIGIGAVPVQAAEPVQPIKDVSASAMAADLVLLRPLGMAATATGVVLYIVSLPFSVPGGNQQMAIDKLVHAPAKFTFQRQLGDI